MTEALREAALFFLQKTSGRPFNSISQPNGAMTNSARHNSCVIFRRSLSVAGIVFAIMVSGCSEPQNSTAPSAADLTLRFGKPVKLLSSQANMVWEDSVNVAAPGAPASWAAAGIRGDGRNKTGQPSTFSEYQGDYCGVSAYLGTDGTSSMNVDTDFGYTSSMTAACGSPARLYRFYYDGAATPTYSFGPHHTVMDLALIAVGQTVSKEVWYGVQQTNCGRLWYGDQYSPSNNVLVTRLPNITGANGTVRQWRVQTQGSHRAMCVLPSNGGRFVSTGVSHFLPFSYTITEVLAPSPVFP